MLRYVTIVHQPETGEADKVRWESGHAWGAMMQYWLYTKDESYMKVMTEGLVAQLGPKYDFVVPAEAFDTGNDDQQFVSTSIRLFFSVILTAHSGYL